MFHSFRTASFGLTGSQNRFIRATEESHYNVSGQGEGESEKANGETLQL